MGISRSCKATFQRGRAASSERFEDREKLAVRMVSGGLGRGRGDASERFLLQVSPLNIARAQVGALDGLIGGVAQAVAFANPFHARVRLAF